MLEVFETEQYERLEQVESSESAFLEPVLAQVAGMGEVLVGGDPLGIAAQLDDEQGDNILNAQGDCGLVSVANMLVQAGFDVSEDKIVVQAVRNGLCHYSTETEPEMNGGTNVFGRKALLAAYGISATVYSADFGGKLSPEQIAQLVETGHGVNISVNAGYAWNDADYIADGGSNHSIIVTGTLRDPETGSLKGIVVCDSGLPGQSSALVMDMDTLKDAYSDVPNASVLVTDQPICA